MRLVRAAKAPHDKLDGAKKHQFCSVAYIQGSMRLAATEVVAGAVQYVVQESIAVHLGLPGAVKAGGACVHCNTGRYIQYISIGVKSLYALNVLS